MNIKKMDVLSLLDKLEVLEQTNEKLSKQVENTNQGIRLIKYELREFINDIDNYERLKREEYEFLELGYRLDQLMINDTETSNNQRSERIVINNIYNHSSKNSNENSNLNKSQ